MLIRIPASAWKDIEKAYFDALDFAKNGNIKSEQEFYQYLSEQWLEVTGVNPMSEPEVKPHEIVGIKKESEDEE